MVHLTRINRLPLVLNADLIEHIETTPDTVISLINGQKFVVAESADEIIKVNLAARCPPLYLVSFEEEKRILRRLMPIISGLFAKTYETLQFIGSNSKRSLYSCAVISLELGLEANSACQSRRKEQIDEN